MRVLRRGDLTSQSLAMPVRIHFGFPSPAEVPDLRIAAANGPMLQLRRDGTATGTMRLTDRDMEILTLLRPARWLETSQLHRRFFAPATLSAARKRLRRLAAAGCIRKHQGDRMREALFTIGREGARLFERRAGGAVALEKRPPLQRDHFLAVNTIRIAAELCGSLSYFFAYWELPAAGWRHSLIPDAVMSLGGRTFALEIDRGVEGIRFFMRTKIAVYRRGLAGFPLDAVLVVADRKTRMEALARAIDDDQGRFLFSTIDEISQHGLLAPVLYRQPDGTGEPAIRGGSAEKLRRENSFPASSALDSRDSGKRGMPS